MKEQYEIINDLRNKINELFELTNDGLYTPLEVVSCIIQKCVEASNELLNMIE